MDDDLSISKEQDHSLNPTKADNNGVSKIVSVIVLIVLILGGGFYLSKKYFNTQNQAIEHFTLNSVGGEVVDIASANIKVKAFPQSNNIEKTIIFTVLIDQSTRYDKMPKSGQQGTVYSQKINFGDLKTGDEVLIQPKIKPAKTKEFSAKSILVIEK